jgi:hypothetical protein
MLIDESKNYEGTLKEVGVFARIWQLAQDEESKEPAKRHQRAYQEFRKLMEEAILPNDFNMVMFRLTKFDLSPFAELCHQHGLSVLVHICDDEANWMIIPKTYEYIKKYSIDGILVERPATYFNETLKEMFPEIELQALVTCEKYLPPWINCNQNMEMYQEDIQGPLFRFIVVETSDHGPMSLSMCKKITEKSVVSPHVAGFHLYNALPNRWYAERCRVVGEVLRAHKIKPERFTYQPEKEIKQSLAELLTKDYYQLSIYVQDLEGKLHAPIWFLNPSGVVEDRVGISREDRIHSPVWTKDSAGRWEWAGVLIPGGAYRPPQKKYNYLFPKRFLKNGTIEVKIDPTWIDASRPLYALHTPTHRWGNFSPGDCRIERITIETPSLTGEYEIEEKILGETKYKEGLKIDEYVPTIVKVTMK